MEDRETSLEPLVSSLSQARSRYPTQQDGASSVLQPALKPKPTSTTADGVHTKVRWAATRAPSSPLHSPLPPSPSPFNSPPFLTTGRSHPRPRPTHPRPERTVLDYDGEDDDEDDDDVEDDAWASAILARRDVAPLPPTFSDTDQQWQQQGHETEPPPPPWPLQSSSPSRPLSNDRAAPAAASGAGLAPLQGLSDHRPSRSLPRPLSIGHHHPHRPQEQQYRQQNQQHRHRHMRGVVKKRAEEETDTSVKAEGEETSLHPKAQHTPPRSLLHSPQLRDGHRDRGIMDRARTADASVQTESQSIPPATAAAGPTLAPADSTSTSTSTPITTVMPLLPRVHVGRDAKEPPRRQDQDDDEVVMATVARIAALMRQQTRRHIAMIEQHSMLVHSLQQLGDEISAVVTWSGVARSEAHGGVPAAASPRPGGRRGPGEEEDEREKEKEEEESEVKEEEDDIL